jgi:uncharacterized protein (TIGR02271 family)
LAEVIVAVFEAASEADAAQRDLESAGIPASAIRRYASSDPAAPRTTATSGSTKVESSGGFWSWLLGEESWTADRNAWGNDPELYERAAGAGRTILSVTVGDSSQVTQATEILDRHGPIDLDERAAGTMPGTGTPAAYPAAGTAFRDAGTAASLSGRETTSSSAPAAGATSATGATGRDETIPLAEERLEVGKRQVDRGTTRVRRYVVETPVEKEDTLRGEKVTVERRTPAAGSAGTPGPGAFEERVVEVRETGEEPVVSKTAQVAEEVVVHREPTERTETVRDTVRREEVEVDPKTGKAATPKP